MRTQMLAAVDGGERSHHQKDLGRVPGDCPFARYATPATGGMRLIIVEETGVPRTAAPPHARWTSPPTSRR
ncbi:hypothetical protein ACFRI7_12775 [Streptomyces sp. NPDC056716]|uniref:hypothetical protein n=1 Tax=Streptomyces sp. NPDC056716 TaxID=3345922 RepID=UPI0036B2348F